MSKPYLTIELHAWKWAAVCLAAPFALMLAFKLSWEVLYWWAQVVFSDDGTAFFWTGMLTTVSWVSAPIVLAIMLVEGSVVLKRKS